MKSSTSDTYNVIPEGLVAPQLNSQQRALLRSRAHALNPVILLGQAGLTEAVLLETHRTLLSHPLIKIKLASDDRQVRDEWSQTICQRLGAAWVQQVGKILVIYRPLHETNPHQ
ncbi:MAG: YhbY family RNA-binding protein [Betaproteobacteria bacterium]|uniref:YhbY family RNA-binding protein n=1 Tax=Ferrovum sp. PN-J185 TaxID=1356306 RepID=UPI0007995933|nr:YhbY family RNA-binding protein [Ferrovum sp. PN-J185]KXW56166.1 RNA-binding protein YhbY [Ferrovum sp. PN-J185]MDE1892210.1 YhbY family RNA-binding protein [Betaproteobacteria bacterium]MDE2057219.1 YhbY family RNA-binding protein [Betaproteobacteria bacterium]